MFFNKQKNKILKILFLIPIFFMMIFPLLTLAQNSNPSYIPLPVNNNTVTNTTVDPTTLNNSNTPPTDENNGLVPCQDNCDWDKLLLLVNNVVHFILFDMLVPIAAIMFCYSGFLMLTSGGNPDGKKKAKSIFSNVVIGLIIAIAAWLIIETLLTVLGYDGSWIGF